MFRKPLCFLLIQMIAAGISAQIPIGIGQWRTHVPYRNASSVANADNKVYVSGNVFFFSYDKGTGELTKYDKVTGLSDVGVTLVKYNSFNSTLFVAYENTNIDLISNNELYNIADIKRKLIVGDKQINNVYFLDDIAYLSMSFGMVVLDMTKKEIKDTWHIGDNGADIKVFSFTSDGSHFYAATEKGVKMADMDASNLASYEAWSLAPGLRAGTASDIVTFGNDVFVNMSDTIFEFNGTNWTAFYSDTSWRIANILVSGSKMMICESSETEDYVGRVKVNDGAGFTAYTHPDLRIPVDGEIAQDGNLWIADGINGLVGIKNGEVQSPVFPNGPGSTNVQGMSADRGQLWVAPGGVSSSFNYLYNSDGIFSHSDIWRNYNQYTNPELIDVQNIWQAKVHPSVDKAYFASWYSGLLETGNGSFTVYDQNNSILKGRIGDPARTLVGGLAFDSYNNLWLTNSEAIGENQIIVIKADGEWLSFRPQGITGKAITDVIVDDYDQKWFIIPRTANQSIVVFNHGATIENPNDGDACKIFGSGAGNGNLPDIVLCLAKDRDGEIWVGTQQGIAVFYCPSAVFSEQGCEAQQIIVTVNGVAGYLLETEVVNAIAVDGANRKWVGTNNGVFVLSPDGTEQINYYTEDNSPLISNNIMDIAIDGETGEVFIGTEKGIVSIRGEATEGDEEHHGVLVYPNPVKETYDGPIAIKGLADNANVKITDVNGVLFYETVALGGQAVWNGRNYNGERAKTGVYLVFSSNEDGSSTNVTKLLIIN